jgi:hypothetical protein
MKCKYEKVLGDGSVMCMLEHDNCVAMDRDMKQSQCDCFVEEDE